MSVLGEQVRDFATGRLGLQVGRGECSDLASAALRAVGARGSFPATGGHPVWGQEVPLAFAEPGDVLQLRNHRVVIRNRDGTGFIETRGHPHHTAIVVENPGNGVLRVAEQNMMYPGARQPERTVGLATIFVTNQTTADQRTVTVQGQIWAYRPVPPVQGAAVRRR